MHPSTRKKAALRQIFELVPYHQKQVFHPPFIQNYFVVRVLMFLVVYLTSGPKLKKSFSRSDSFVNTPQPSYGPTQNFYLD